MRCGTARLKGEAMKEIDKKNSATRGRNCWEFMNCGREPGGDDAEKMGVCPAAMPGRYDGTNNGKYAGRFCWAMPDTQCKAKSDGDYAQKLLNCIYCEFFKLVQEEESFDFIMSPRSYDKKAHSGG